MGSKNVDNFFFVSTLAIRRFTTKELITLMHASETPTIYDPVWPVIQQAATALSPDEAWTVVEQRSVAILRSLWLEDAHVIAEGVLKVGADSAAATQMGFGLESAVRTLGAVFVTESIVSEQCGSPLGAGVCEWWPLFEVIYGPNPSGVSMVRLPSGDFALYQLTPEEADAINCACWVGGQADFDYLADVRAFRASVLEVILAEAFDA